VGERIKRGKEKKTREAGIKKAERGEERREEESPLLLFVSRSNHLCSVSLAWVVWWFTWEEGEIKGTSV